jgi:hypothetical protein
MNLPFTLPDWLPAWAFLLLAIPALLFVLAFLLMPFSVFGVKARLEAVEAQLDAMTEELRNLNFRNRGVSGRAYADDGDAFDTLPNFGRHKPVQSQSQSFYEDSRAAPPVPPPLTPMVDPRDKPGAAKLPQRPARRTEPRLD